MTEQNREEIRGITYSMIRTFIGCTIAIISAIVGGCVYIKTSISTLDFRTAAIEEKDRSEYTPLITEVGELKAWKTQVEAFYMPPKRQSATPSEE